MRERTKSRLYLGAFAVATFVTVVLCGYYEGRADEVVSRESHQTAVIDQALKQRDYWKGKYDALANESDGITLIAAEMHYQQGRR